ncbi:hypothetical protein JV16_01592 [Anoxybacillus ayderensis]|uniref:Uncharacterized protein n=1 Tax=Anoxybacillus ayderensis TaxID=265546 RepID=A0A0D0HT74_9BACL|nr:hypothetical protein [Anoxybacillus ayderensis]KIP21098.1 hypothetical protein JV16_01592 [Anoxybacillus ayderensis]
MSEKEQELIRKFEELVLTLPAHELAETLGCSQRQLYRLRNQIRSGCEETSAVSYKGVITLLAQYVLDSSLPEEKLQWMKAVGIKEFPQPMKYHYGTAWVLSEQYIRETPLEKLKARFLDVKDKPYPF